MKRSPKIAFLLILLFSAFVFAYINFCPTTHQIVESNSFSVKNVLKMPEFEAVVHVVKVVIAYLLP